MKSTRTTPPLMDRIRLAVGMLWRRERPGLREAAPALRTAGLIVLLLLAWGIVGRLDYEIERAAELEARADRLAPRAAVAEKMEVRAALATLDVARLEDYLLACLNDGRHWVLGGERWECKARPVGPYVIKED